MTGMFLALTFYACMIGEDMDFFGGFLSVSLMMMLCFIVLSTFFNVTSIRILVVVIFVILIAQWAIFDINLMLENSKRYKVDLSENVLAALIIYADIFTFIIHIIELIGTERNPIDAIETEK